MMRRFLAALSCALAMEFTGTSHAAQPPPAPAVGQAPPAPVAPRPLTREDLEPWLDGFMPNALKSGDIAGAVVVVVKDGQVLFARGYGYADVARGKPVDPAITLFRPGSISKLFTWTAVMQLAEQGKLDLDRDVNAYLDFRIPPKDGKPVTLRQIMTHTAGFEEHLKALFVAAPARPVPLAEWEKTQLPRRIFPPGQTPAYSNYAAALAGYIVQRVSGEPFEAYVEHHIFTPLGMVHATFRQPLPPTLAPDMSQAYKLGAGDPKPFEIVNGPPAGALAASGGDLARFMIAILDDGRSPGGAHILKPQTVRVMLTPAFQATPPLNGMSLGWFMDDRNGHRARGHGGDLQYHHSQLDILPDDHVGLFVSLNSAGSGAATQTVRASLFDEFMDRYFPAPVPDEPALATAKADGAKIAGFYEVSRRGQTTPLSILRLVQQVQVKVDDKGLVSAPAVDKLLGVPERHWREVAPMVWREVGGKSRIAAVVTDGKAVTLFSDAIPQFAVLQPVPASLRMSWRLPAFGVSLAILLLFVVSWPGAVIARRVYGARFKLSGRAAMLHRAGRITALLDVVFVIAWMGLLLRAGSDISKANASLDPALRGAQVVGVLGLVGLAFTAWNLVAVWRGPERGWWARIASLILLAACLFVDWTMFAIHAFNLSLAY